MIFDPNRTSVYPAVLAGISVKLGEGGLARTLLEGAQGAMGPRDQEGKKMKDFRGLKVWQDGKELTVAIYRITDTFPRREVFGLTDQLRRAANSVCANIAEGFDRFHTKDKIRFYYNSRGSISECISHLSIAAELNYLSVEEARSQGPSAP